MLLTVVFCYIFSYLRPALTLLGEAECRMLLYLQVDGKDKDPYIPCIVLFYSILFKNLWNSGRRGEEDGKG